MTPSREVRGEKGKLMRSLLIVRMFLGAVLMLVPGFSGSSCAVAQTVGPMPALKPTALRVANSPIPMFVLVQSPSETRTELQIICLFRSEPSNPLHGSLLEMNEKLKGLLDQIRTSSLFRGDLGETLLIGPPAGGLGAKRVLIIGLGDSETFVPERMELVGAVAYREASRLGVARPFFAPTVIDGGVTTSAPEQVAEQVIRGFLRAARTEKAVQDGGASRGTVIQELTFLAGPQHVADARKGIEKAVAADGAK
jgi:hypothetical protein